MIRIVLADDHALIRQAIARALADVAEFQVVGQASTAEEALGLIARQAPQVVLMDISMPGMGGLAATEAIRTAHPQVGVLILTIHDREDYLFKALRAGASGYILKGAELEELIEAIQAISRGDIYIYPAMVPKLVTDYLQRAQRGGPEADELSRLTPREREYPVHRRASAPINRPKPPLSYTVRRHREHIMEKLNLHSKTELIRFAIYQGLPEKSE